MKETSFVKKTEEFLKKLDIDVVKKSFVFDELDSTNWTAKESCTGWMGRKEQLSSPEHRIMGVDDLSAAGNHQKVECISL